MIALLLLLQDAVVSERDLKAAFLFNFARHVDWPAEAFPTNASPFVIAVVGGDGMADAVEGAFKDKVVQGHPVALRRSVKGERLEGVHLVFVAAGVEAAPILRSLRGTWALSVGESPGFLAAGGVMNFFVEDRRLRFEVGLPAATRAGLNVSSKLLRLARVVRGDE